MVAGGPMSSPKTSSVPMASNEATIDTASSTISAARGHRSHAQGGGLVGVERQGHERTEQGNGNRHDHGRGQSLAAQVTVVTPRMSPNSRAVTSVAKLSDREMMITPRANIPTNNRPMPVCPCAPGCGATPA